MMLLVPIMMSSNLVLFDNVLLNIFGKIILIVGALEVEKKAIGLITGILADQAGWQATSAGDMKDTAHKFMDGMMDTATGAGRLGWGATKLAGKGAFYGGKYGAKGIYYGGKYGAKGAYYGGKYAGKGLMGLGQATASGLSWVGSKLSNMFPRDTGASGGGANNNNFEKVNPFEGIEMTDMSNVKQPEAQQPAKKVQQPAAQQPAAQQPAAKKVEMDPLGGGAIVGTYKSTSTGPKLGSSRGKTKGQPAAQQPAAKKVQQPAAQQSPASNMKNGLDPLSGGPVGTYKSTSTGPKLGSARRPTKVPPVDNNKKK